MILDAGHGDVRTRSRPVPDEIEVIPGVEEPVDDRTADDTVADEGAGARAPDARAPGPTPEALGLAPARSDLLPPRHRWWRRSRRAPVRPTRGAAPPETSEPGDGDGEPATTRRVGAPRVPERRRANPRRPDLSGFALDRLPEPRERRRGWRDRSRDPGGADTPRLSPGPEPQLAPGRDSQPAPRSESQPAPRPGPVRATEPDAPVEGTARTASPRRRAARAIARTARRERRLARHRVRRRRWMLRRVCTALVVAALGIPIVVAALVLKPQRVAAQVSTPRPTLGEPQRRLYTAFRANTTQVQPVIVSYHDIRPQPKKDRRDPYTVAPQRFAEQMEMLDEAGFTTLDSKQVLAWLGGAPVPPRSVWITFDDAPKGLWIYADPILARHHFHATVFTITGVVGTHQPYYLNWPELTQLSRTGRWDVEAHTHLGHWRIPVDASGHTGPFLVNRQWLSAQHRLETIEEWDRRVTNDLRASRDDLVRHGFPMPVFFAYPFSAVTFPTNDPRIPPILETRTRQLFRMSVVNAENAGLVTRRDVAKHLLPRVEVLGATTTRVMFDHVAMWEPLEVAQLRPFAESGRWVDEQGHPVPASAFSGDSLTLAPTTTYGSAFFAPGRLASWTDYQSTVHVAGLGVPTSGASASLHVLSGSDGEYAVSVSAGWVRILRGRTSQQALVLDRAIRRGDAHDVAAAMSNGRVSVAIDGVLVYDAPEEDVQLGLPAGGVGLSVYRNRADSPQPVFSGIRIEPIGGSANTAGV